MSHKGPLFSIVVPAYNREALIKVAIDSVLAQTFGDFELIVVDDASKDKTCEAVLSYTDPRVKLIRQAVNGERGKARNTGIESAKGRYICLLDSDDRFLPNHLENFNKHLTATGFKKALYFGNAYNENIKGERSPRPQLPYDERNKFAYILHYTFNPTRTCIDRDIMLEMPFDVSIPGIEDLDLWLRIAVKYPLVQLQEYTAIYLEHDGSYTSGDEKRFEKELRNFKTVFAKPELRNLLPQREKRFLLSKCYYHLAIINNRPGTIGKMYGYIIKAFFTFPEGYNVNANKAMLTMFLYNLPVLGWLIKKTIRSFK